MTCNPWGTYFLFLVVVMKMNIAHFILKPKTGQLRCTSKLYITQQHRMPLKNNGTQWQPRKHNIYVSAWVNKAKKHCMSLCNGRLVIWSTIHFNGLFPSHWFSARASHVHIITCSCSDFKNARRHNQRVLQLVLNDREPSDLMRGFNFSQRSCWRLDSSQMLHSVEW